MLKEIRIAKEKDCPKMLELLEYICNLHSGIRPDLFKAGKSKYDSESLAKLLADENRITFVAADENDEVLGYIFCILSALIANHNFLTISHSSCNRHSDLTCTCQYHYFLIHLAPPCNSDFNNIYLL